MHPFTRVAWWSNNVRYYTAEHSRLVSGHWDGACACRIRLLATNFPAPNHGSYDGQEVTGLPVRDMWEVRAEAKVLLASSSRILPVGCCRQASLLPTPVGLLASAWTWRFMSIRGWQMGHLGCGCVWNRFEPPSSFIEHSWWSIPTSLFWDARRPKIGIWRGDGTSCSVSKTQGD